jgi:glutaredoxin
MAIRSQVEIFGKDDCPYTLAARQDYQARGLEVTYHDVTRDVAARRRFLELSQGERGVPLILDQGRVQIGFGGT